MDTRTVTVLFTDLVGSTARFAALDPAEAERVRDAHITLVEQTVRALDGAVVKSLGDGVMATFASAASGLAAAAAIQRAVVAHRPGTMAPLGVRVGVSAGDASRSDEGDWHGPCVVEASRLCAVAEAQQVVVAEVVARLAGERGHGFEDVGSLALKGLAAPTPALSLLWRLEQGAPLRVALADDSALVREGIARLLESAGVDVVSRAADGDALVADVLRLAPDIVITDLRMPPGGPMGGLLAVEAIRRAEPLRPVVLLSTDVEQHVATRLLANGSDGIGYLSKDRVTDLDHFVDAIRAVAAGGCVLDEALRSADGLSDR